MIAAIALRCVRPRPKLVVHARDGLPNSTYGRLVSTVIGREADTIVAISRYVARNFAAANGKVHVLHNAIDPALYCCAPDDGLAFRRQFGVPQDAPLLAVVGQLTPWKGQLEALEAFALLRLSVPHAHLAIAGSIKFEGKHRRYDNRTYYDTLISYTQRSALHEYTHFVGETAGVAAIYSASTLVIVPSWAEPFGRVVIEAMAAGCPVIATNAGGIPEIITHGADGWLVPPRTPRALAQAMRELLADAGLRDALSRHGRMTVESRFDLSGYMSRLEALWRIVI